MKIFICDDNHDFALQLRARVSKYCLRYDFDFECVVFTSSTELLKQDLSSVQILFLDIDMPGINGIDLARQLRNTLPELMIVFVTSWIQYAPSGYEVSAFRYLLKESLTNEFEHCMDDIVEKLNIRYQEASFTKKNGTLLTIPIPHILFIEGSSYRHVYVHNVGNGKPVYECVGKLADYSQSLSDRGFLRIQRSYLVNMLHIREIKNYTVILSNGDSLQSSRKYFSSLKSEYTLWKAGRL